MQASLRALIFAGVALTAFACTVKKADNPPATGPSELALSLTVLATPDILPQDGSSQSRIAIVARDANAQPVAGLAMRADIVVDGVIADFGSLNTKSPVTGSDGRATLTYTAPQSVGSTGLGRTISIRLTPVGTDARSQDPRVVDIRLVPPGVIEPPGPAVPNFTMAPAAPVEDTNVTFDASDPNLDLILADYRWNFGDGSTASGRTVQHQFDNAGSFAVTLTVTDADGFSASRTKTVAVSAGVAPIASFVFSPAAPSAGDTVFFNGSESSAAPGRTIVTYRWNFGTSGSSVTGRVVSKVFNVAGTYNVTLTVTDDAGVSATTSESVLIAP
jgi:PKD repeat protein